ncbi:hypothetical protein D3C87_82620 [compost metagenome]
MSQAYNELVDLNTNSLKLRESIHKNEIFLKATEEQEKAFYNMLNALLNRTKAYVNKYKDMRHVIELEDFYVKAKEYLHEGFTFDFDELKKMLDQQYEDERKDDEGNFVAAADMTILYPIRIINERMYRTLTGEKKDVRFDNLFNETSKY